MPRKLAKESTQSLKKLGAKETINSGAISNFLGDGIISLYQEIIWGMYDKIMVEHKATQKKSFSVTKDILKKIVREAKYESALPVVQVQLIDENKQSDEYIIIRQSDFKDLINYIAFVQGKRDGLIGLLNRSDDRT